MEGVVVYALGGGAGHLARALVYVERFVPPPASVTVLHAAGTPVVRAPCARVHLRPIEPHATPIELRAIVAGELGARRDRALIVDTFPAGLARELDDALLARAARTVLLRRFVKPLSYVGYAEAAARFDEVVLPYDRDRSEWDARDAPPDGQRAIHAGPLVRRLRVDRGPRAPLAVIGDRARLGLGWRRALPPGTRFVEGPFDALPAARAYLGTAAGYHLSYELAGLGVPFGLMPVEKRYDDQFRRADLLGRAVLDLAGLEALLAEAA